LHEHGRVCTSIPFSPIRIVAIAIAIAIAIADACRHRSGQTPG
jgi:hypothetical protein